MLLYDSDKRPLRHKSTNVDGKTNNGIDRQASICVRTHSRDAMPVKSDFAVPICYPPLEHGLYHRVYSTWIVLNLS